MRAAIQLALLARDELGERAAACPSACSAWQRSNVAICSALVLSCSSWVRTDERNGDVPLLPGRTHPSDSFAYETTRRLVTGACYRVAIEQACLDLLLANTTAITGETCLRISAVLRWAPQTRGPLSSLPGA